MCSVQASSLLRCLQEDECSFSASVVLWMCSVQASSLLRCLQEDECSFSASVVLRIMLSSGFSSVQDLALLVVFRRIRIITRLDPVVRPGFGPLTDRF